MVASVRQMHQGCLEAHSMVIKWQEHLNIRESRVNYRNMIS